MQENKRGREGAEGIYIALLIYVVVLECKRTRVQTLVETEKCLCYIWRPRCDLGYLWRVREIVSSTSPHRCCPGRFLSLRGRGQCGSVSHMAFILALANGLPFSSIGRVLDCHARVETPAEAEHTVTIYTMTTVLLRCYNATFL